MEDKFKIICITSCKSIVSDKEINKGESFFINDFGYNFTDSYIRIYLNNKKIKGFTELFPKSCFITLAEYRTSIIESLLINDM